MAESVETTNYVRIKVEDACEEAGLPPDSPIKALLMDEARVVDGVRGEYYVRAYRADGDVPLKTRIEEFRQDKKTAHYFPGEQPTEVSAKMGTQNLSDHFSDIASGKVRVTD